MKLRAAQIRAFRGFGKLVELTFGDTNVFAGRNGFGKTSLFDAIQWCLFGVIPRLAGTRDFTKAGDVLQNKFYPDPYFVELVFQNGAGDRLWRKRTATECRSMRNNKDISHEGFMHQIGFSSDDAHQRFLRSFLLQQEEVNDFVRDLNPRGRYDAMLSLLQFDSPEILTSRLMGIRDQLLGKRSPVAGRVERAEARLASLERDIDALTKASSALSLEVINQRYAAMLADSQELRQILGFEPTRQDVRAELVTFSNLLATERNAARQLEVALSEWLRLSERFSSEYVSVQGSAMELSHTVDRLTALLANRKEKTAETREYFERSVRELSETSRLVSRTQSLLAEIKGIVQSDACPVCKRPIDKAQLLATIDSGIGQSAQDLESLHKNRDSLQSQLDHEQGEEQDTARELAAAQADLLAAKERSELQAELNERIEAIRALPLSKRLLASVSIGDNSPRELVNQLSLAGARFVAELDGFQSICVELLELSERLSATALLPQKIEERQQVQGERIRGAASLESFATMENTLKRCVQAVSETRSSLVAQLLESSKPLIQSLYARLQPHPLLTEIDFEVVRAYREAELYFRVLTSDHKVFAYPATVFSASQLNALAVCIFLALSLRSTWDLEVLMLDDPIQSMDDINVLGMSDVLRQLKPSRQLFVSTHSRDFYQLLMNKLRPSGSTDTVRGFQFEGWSVEGPQIREEDLDYMPVSFDAAEISSLIRNSAA